MEIDLGRIKLGKGDLIMGLGKGRALYISSEGDVSEVGGKTLPDFAYLMYPLVARVIPEEFEGPGNFPDIVELEKRLGEIFGSAERVYEKVGPALAAKGVPAVRLAKTFLEMSPVRIWERTGNISQDTYKEYTRSLTRIITKYYPGSTLINKKLARPNRPVVLDMGKRREKMEYLSNFP